MSDIIGRLAELIYIDSLNLKSAPGDAYVCFAALPKKEQGDYAFRAANLLMMLDKLDYAVILKVEHVENKKLRESNLEILEQIIRDFVSKLNTTRPEYFPVTELALKIYDPIKG